MYKPLPKLSFYLLNYLLLIVIVSFVPVCTWAGENHACDYITKEDVEKVMGLTVTTIEPHPANPMGQSICFFDIDAGMSIRFAQLQMMRSGWSKKSAFTAETLFKNNMSYLQSAEEVDGIGSKAYWGGSGMKMGGGLHVYFKDVYFTILTATGDDEKNWETAEDLAKIVIERVK